MTKAGHLGGLFFDRLGCSLHSGRGREGVAVGWYSSKVQFSSHQNRNVEQHSRCGVDPSWLLANKFS